MFKRVAPLVTVLSLLASCSHHSPQKANKPFPLAKSWLNVIKSNKPGKPKGDRRIPASSEVPGLKEFIKALKSHPQVFNVPVGYEVITSDFSIYEGEEYRSEQKTVYLKQNHGGHFTLDVEEDESSTELEIH